MSELSSALVPSKSIFKPKNDMAFNLLVLMRGVKI